MVSCSFQTSFFSLTDFWFFFYWNAHYIVVYINQQRERSIHLTCSVECAALCSLNDDEQRATVLCIDKQTINNNGNSQRNNVWLSHDSLHRVVWRISSRSFSLLTLHRLIRNDVECLVSVCFRRHLLTSPRRRHHLNLQNLQIIVVNGPTYSKSTILHRWRDEQQQQQSYHHHCTVGQCVVVVHGACQDVESRTAMPHMWSR